MATTTDDPHKVERNGDTEGDSNAPRPSPAPPEIRGGYECEFIDPPPAAFQTDCPVCLQVLREPCVISCPCGQKLCLECIELIKRDGKPCPLCNKTDFTFMRDYGLERALKEYEVWCSYESNGCDWKGRLRDLEEHLNEKPPLENRHNGCQFVALECTFGCGEFFQRHVITSHENQFCLRRPYLCLYCMEYDSTYADVTEAHFTQCPKYPVTCPNDGCELKLKRQDVEIHIKETCPLTEVECPLHYAGCQVKLPRKDISQHMNDTTLHLTLLATVTHSLLRENQQLKWNVQDLKKENEELKSTVQKLKENKDTGNEQFSQLQLKILTVDVRTELLGKSIQSIKEDVQHMKVHKLGIPVEFIVKKGGDEVYLPPFYTHSNGYRVCLNVMPKGEGAGYLSLYVCLMSGLFDDHLKWPFRGSVTIQIVNQIEDYNHYQRTITYHDTTDEDTAGRVAPGQQRSHGWGRHKFFPLNEFRRWPVNNTLYAKDGLFKVRVTNVSLF